MISITKAQVPAYLKDSFFYEALCSDDTEPFRVPLASFKSTVCVSRVEDVAHLLRTLQYWGVQDVPCELTSYLTGVHSTLEYEQVYNLLVDFDSHTRFSKWYKAIQTLRMVKAESDHEDTIRNVKRSLLVLVDELSSQIDVVSEQAATSLVEAVESRKCSKHHVLCYLRNVSSNLLRITRTSVVRSIAKLYSIVCEEESCPASSFPLLLHLLSSLDDATVEFACKALVNSFNDSNVHALYDAGYLPRCVSLMCSKNLLVQQVAVMAVKEFVRDSEEWTEQVSALGALSVVKDLLGSDVPAITRDACVIVFNFIGEGPALQHLLDAGIYLKIREMQQAGKLKYPAEVADILCYTLYNADVEQARQLVDQGAFASICKAMTVQDPDAALQLVQDLYFCQCYCLNQDVALRDKALAQFVDCGGVKALESVAHLPNMYFALKMLPRLRAIAKERGIKV